MFRLTARQDISCEAITVVERIIWYALSLFPRLNTTDCSLENRPAATDPMTVTAVDKLVGPTSKATLWGILPS